MPERKSRTVYKLVYGFRPDDKHAWEEGKEYLIKTADDLKYILQTFLDLPSRYRIEGVFKK